MMNFVLNLLNFALKQASFGAWIPTYAVAAGSSDEAGGDGDAPAEDRQSSTPAASANAPMMA